MSDTKKVDSLIAEDGFTVSRKDLVLVDGYEMCVEEMWSDGTVFVAFGHGEEKEVTIEDLDSSMLKCAILLIVIVFLIKIIRLSYIHANERK